MLTSVIKVVFVFGALLCKVAESYLKASTLKTVACCRMKVVTLKGNLAVTG